MPGMPFLRYLEAILVEREDTLVIRWVVRYSQLIALAAINRKQTVAHVRDLHHNQRRMGYLFRVVDKFGDTIDFMLSERRAEASATAFFKQAINDSDLPEKEVMDKGANLAGLFQHSAACYQ